MIRLRKNAIIGMLMALATGGMTAWAQATNELPDYQDVYNLVREHAHISGPELNRAAVEGLLAELAPKVKLVTNEAGAATEDGPAVSRTSLFNGDIAYARVGRVTDGLAQTLEQKCRGLGATNQLRGLVIDLRYAGGSDYAAVAATADLFVKKERPLLNWGEGVVKSKEKTRTLIAPVAVLVNEGTRGPAEALAAVLRETGAGLILGTRTAGQAMITQDFPLHDGQQLRIATAPIQLGDGTVLSAKGVEPDIAVSVTPQDERKYYADAFRQLQKINGDGAPETTASLSTTNAPGRRSHFNEAELVRERREGSGIEDAFSTNELQLGRTNATENDSEEPVVHDPALARALDLLKGLAVVRQSRS